MKVTRISSYWWLLLFRMVLPPVITVALFTILAFWFVLPTLEENMLAGKREMLREITTVVLHQLESYNQEVRDGRHSLEEMQAIAVDDIRNMRYGADGKDYFWINNYQPKMVMHPFRTDLDGKDISHFTDPNGKKLFAEMVDKVKRNGSGYVEYMWQWKDNPELIVPKVSYVEAFEPWGWIIGTGIYIEDTKAKISSITRDLSLLIIGIVILVLLMSLYIVWFSARAESRRREWEARLQELTQMLPEAIFEADADMNLTYANQIALSEFGYIWEELEKGLNCFEMLAPEEREWAMDNLEKNKDTDSIRSFEYRALRKDGTTFPILLRIRAITRGGKVIGHRGVVVNISERKKMEEALRENEDKMRSIFRVAPIGIGVVSNRVILDINDYFCKVLGYAKDELINQNTRMLYPGEQEYDKVAQVLYSQVREMEQATMEIKFRKKSGEDLDILLSLAPLEISAMSTSYTFTALDITERRQLEEERGRAAKLESVGVLAGGIAHDFNNILTVIIGNLGLARLRAMKENSKTVEMFGDVENAVMQAKELTLQLLTFAKGGEPQKKTMSLQKIINDSAEFALRGSNVLLNCRIDEGLYPCEVDAGQLSQVINNMVINANHAMPEGGEILIIGTNIPSGSRENHLLGADRYVKITIRDRGVGISEDNLPKIFDPYFTTKKSGSGLGLATSYSIIQRHGGLITVESEENRGTAFHIFLPASNKLPESAESAAEGKKQISAKILLMDDDELVIKVVSRMLNVIGHEVVCVNNGERAVEEYRGAMHSDKPFDAVILDLTIRGGTGGGETIRQLLQIDPDIKAVVSSGYSNDPIVANYREYGFKSMVSKPYKIEVLKNTLQEVLSAD